MSENGTTPHSTPPDDDHSRLGRLEWAVAELRVESGTQHNAVIDAVDRLGAKLNRIDAGVAELRGSVANMHGALADFEGRVMVEFSRNAARDTEARVKLDSMSTEVTLHTAALGGFQVLGVFFNRHKSAAGVVAWLGLVVLHLFQMFTK